MDLYQTVDAHLSAALLPPDDVLDRALARSEAAGLPPIAVAPNQGKLLHLLARMSGARRILEVGTLGGYSTIWLGRALPPDGRLTTLELDPEHAAVARENLADAGLADRVEVLVGPAAATLATLDEPFDFVFIDADKPSNALYVEHALRLSHPGTVILVDNTVRAGRIADDDTDDPGVLGTRAMHALLSADPRVEATAVQTVGVKGHDGFTLAVVS
jgi:predicted O-methyltransferase YrrM